MKKAELITELVAALMEPERLRELLLVLDPAAWDIFYAVYETGFSAGGDMGSPQYRLLEEFGYLYRTEPSTGSAIFMPTEIRALCSDLFTDGLLEQKKRYDLFHQFIEASINLYGIISQDEFIDLFNHYNKESTTVDELFPCMIRHIAVDAGYCLWEEYIVSNEFEDNDFQDVKDLVRKIGAKPRYMPERAEFLRYADPDYYERNTHIDNLQKFLTSKLKVNALVAEEIVLEIRYACAIEAPTQAIVNILNEYNVSMQPAFVQEFLALIANVSNNTRLWSNNGHTPNELHRQEASVVERRKIGRNDPCPCGSGKKYKKCCGR